MKYEDEFTLDFMRRTLAIVNDYSGDLDATMLLNSLLGLLVVPKEKYFNSFPNDKPDVFESNWGVLPKSIVSYGKCSQCKTHNKQTFRQVLKSLRNAVAHFNIKPLNGGGKCVGFVFTDKSGFEAKLSLNEISTLTKIVAQHLDKHLNSIVKK